MGSVRLGGRSGRDDRRDDFGAVAGVEWGAGNGVAVDDVLALRFIREELVARSPPVETEAYAAPRGYPALPGLRTRTRSQRWKGLMGLARDFDRG